LRCMEVSRERHTSGDVLLSASACATQVRSEGVHCCQPKHTAKAQHVHALLVVRCATCSASVCGPVRQGRRVS
jgi:hypothetical protein